MKKQDPEQLLQKAMALGNAIREIESIDLDRSYEKTMRKAKRSKRTKLYMSLMKYAAFFSLPLLMTSLILGWMYFSKPDSAERFAEVISANGSIMRYELPDHSVVWLNSGSKLRYPVAFQGDSRNVELTGEAYFEVEADKKRPFYVNMTDGLKVYVYGTKFNVSAYGDDTSIETVLEKGKVNVITPQAKELVLNPGERVLYNRESGQWTKDKVDVYEKVAWKDGKLIFRNASLDEIFKRLSRHFNVDIELSNRYNREYRYRATFRNETLPQILDYLAQSARMKWQLHDSSLQDDETLSRKKVTVELY